jgi:hypothetical protein
VKICAETMRRKGRAAYHFNNTERWCPCEEIQGGRRRRRRRRKQLPSPN